MKPQRDEPEGGASEPWVALAGRLGDAVQAAREALDALAHQQDSGERPGREVAPDAVEDCLRRLGDAIDAAAVLERDAPGVAPCGQELAFIVEAGVDPAVFGDAARRRAAGWLVASAVRDAHARANLDAVAGLTAFDVLPELRTVGAAFPSRDDELDQYTFLRSPLEELSGLSPVRWLLLGGTVDTVLDLIEEFGDGHADHDRLAAP